MVRRSLGGEERDGGRGGGGGGRAGGGGCYLSLGHQLFINKNSLSAAKSGGNKNQENIPSAKTTITQAAVSVVSSVSCLLLVTDCSVLSV